MLDESQDFFLMDVFTFNDFIKKEFAEKVDPIYIGKEFADKILEKRKKDPNVEIILSVGGKAKEILTYSF